MQQRRHGWTDAARDSRLKALSVLRRQGVELRAAKDVLLGLVREQQADPRAVPRVPQHRGDHLQHGRDPSAARDHPQLRRLTDLQGLRAQQGLHSEGALAQVGETAARPEEGELRVKGGGDAG